MNTYTLLGALAAISISATTQAVAGPVGEWKIADGSANISIHSCGGNLCGFVSWSKNGDGVVGKEVLVSMRPDGALWSGTVINVRDGQRYIARMSMQDEQTLKVEGCVMGGMICGGQQWQRVR